MSFRHRRPFKEIRVGLTGPLDQKAGPLGSIRASFLGCSGRTSRQRQHEKKRSVDSPNSQHMLSSMRKTKMTQRKETGAQNVDLQLMGNDSEILKVIKKVLIFSWMDFRIVMDQRTPLCLTFPSPIFE